MPLQIRRGTDAERQAMTVPLAAGEPLFTTDEGFLYIGNANTLGGVKVSGYADEDAIDAVGLALVAGSNNGITFVYGVTQDNANRIDATVNISQLLQNLNLNGFSIIGTGNINIAGTLTADFKGSVFGDDSTPLIDGVDSRIHLDGTVKGNIVPDANVVYDIGSTNFRFRDLYLSGSSIELGAATITATGSSVNLPAGSTVGGVTIGTGSETGTDDYSGNIIGDDSSIIVNTSTNTVSGIFVGDITGSVFGDNSSLLIDATEGKIVGDIENDLVNSIIITLQGITGSGDPAGLVIKTEEDLNTPFDYFSLVAANNGADGPAMLFTRTRGTLQVPTVSVKDDMIVSQYWLGAKLDGTTEVAAAISVYVDEVPGASSVPGRFEFSTTDNAGALNVALSLDKDGVIGIRDNSLLVGVASGEVDIGGAIKYVKVTVGGVDYALAMYPLNP